MERLLGGAGVVGAEEDRHAEGRAVDRRCAVRRRVCRRRDRKVENPGEVEAEVENETEDEKKGAEMKACW